jgi:His-Xaa-Ser system protein HxsD
MILELTFQGHNLEVLEKAAYRFTDKFAIQISTDGVNHICALDFPPAKSQEAIDNIVRDFKNEVLDQKLRVKIRAESEPIRNLILAHAFSKTSLIKDEQV